MKSLQTCVFCPYFRCPIKANGVRFITLSQALKLCHFTLVLLYIERDTHSKSHTYLFRKYLTTINVRCW